MKGIIPAFTGLLAVSAAQAAPPPVALRDQTEPTSGAPEAFVASQPGGNRISTPIPDPKANSAWIPRLQFDVDPLTPKGAQLSVLAGYAPGLASDLLVFSTTGFSCTRGNVACANSPAPTKVQRGGTAPKVSVSFDGKVTIEPPTDAAQTFESPAESPDVCKANSIRTYAAPTNMTEAIADIDSNAADECHAAHVIDLAKALISRSDALCAVYVTRIDTNQRLYRTSFSIASSIFGAVGTLVPPAKIFSALSGLSSGVSGSIDSGAYGGEAAYLLGSAILSAQQENRSKLYSRLGIPDPSAGESDSSGHHKSNSNNGSTITITYSPPLEGVVTSIKQPAAGRKPKKPLAVPTPVKPATVTISLAENAIASKPNDEASPTKADLKNAPFGTVYSEILSYHAGCSIRVGLNQLQSKLNVGSPGQAEAQPAGESGAKTN
jgi:hypothetical protein